MKRKLFTLLFLVITNLKGTELPIVEAVPVANPITIPSGSEVMSHIKKNDPTFFQSESTTSNSVSTTVNKEKQDQQSVIAQATATITTGLQKNQCSVCSRILSKPSDLKKHMRTHTGERPFPCNHPGCRKRFTQKSIAKDHMRTHTGEKPFPCGHPDCSKRFARRRGLTAHMRTHTGEKPFQCAICNQSFRRKESVTRHMRIHTGEKPYQCNYPGCGKKFRHQNSLKDHARIHTDKEPFKCEICDRVYTLLRNLKRHKKSHDKKK